MIELAAALVLGGAGLFLAQTVLKEVRRTRKGTKPPADDPETGRIEVCEREVRSLRLEVSELVDRLDRWGRKFAKREARENGESAEIPTENPTGFPQLAPTSPRAAKKAALRAQFGLRR